MQGGTVTVIFSVLHTKKRKRGKEGKKWKEEGREKERKGKKKGREVEGKTKVKRLRKKGKGGGRNHRDTP